jgi:hypothetical protein
MKPTLRKRPVVAREPAPLVALPVLDRGEGRLDGIGRAQVFPVLGREVEMRQQRLAVGAQALRELGILRPIGFARRVELLFTRRLHERGRRGARVRCATERASPSVVVCGGCFFGATVNEGIATAFVRRQSRRSEDS